MNTQLVNQKLVADGRDLRYIEGFWAGYHLAVLTAEQQAAIRLSSFDPLRAAAEAEYLLREQQAKLRKQLNEKNRWKTSGSSPS